MKKLFLVLWICMVVFASCSSSKMIASAVGTAYGSSFAKAIVINEKSERQGIDAEYAYLRQAYPGYKTRKQSLASHEKKNYDILDIVTADGQEKSVYFDISNFFGKF